MHMCACVCRPSMITYLHVAHTVCMYNVCTLQLVHWMRMCTCAHAYAQLCESLMEVLPVDAGLCGIYMYIYIYIYIYICTLACRRWPLRLRRPTRRAGTRHTTSSRDDAGIRSCARRGCRWVRVRVRASTSSPDGSGIRSCARRGCR